MPHPTKKIHDDDLLKQALRFDDDDLAANQAGEFSTRQSARLRWNRAIQRACAIMLFGAGVPIAGLTLY